MAETTEHRELKRLSCRWLREQGHVAVAMEVTDPTGRFRVDVAGWTDRGPGPIQTVVIECKRSRGDYMRDGVRASGLLSRRAALLEDLRARGLRPAMLFSVNDPPAQPTLFDDHRLDAARPGRAVRRIRVELAAIERQLFRGAKFARMARWRGASQLWVAAPRGLVSPGELPLGWGLLEAPLEALRSPVPEGIAAGRVLAPRREAPGLGCSEASQARLLRNIAVANSRYVGGRAHQGNWSRKWRESPSPGSRSVAG
ncbi:MAG: hypothetical protein MK116_06170 [Phycisphaerales bacterium]|nr:hypothetical protein [Phycisphaerales bacterium]